MKIVVLFNGSNIKIPITGKYVNFQNLININIVNSIYSTRLEN